MAFAQVFGKILQIGGGVAQSTGSLRQGLAQATQFEFKSQQARNNAELARQDQLLARSAGQVERSNISKEEQLLRGEGKSAYAGGNVRLDEGTPLEFDIAAAEQAAVERERSRDEEALRIQRLETERQGLLAESKLLRKAAKSTRKSAQLQFGGSIASTVGGAMSSFGGK